MLTLKACLKEGLKEAGIKAGDAGDWRLGELIIEKALYISLRQAVAAQGAMQSYLGCDAEGCEVYGMQMEVKSALVLLSPKGDGGYGVEAFAEEVMNVLLSATQRLGIRAICCEEMAFDSLRDCFRQEIVLTQQVMAYGARTDEGIALEEFRVLAEVQS